VTNTATGPLAGVRIVDLTSVVFGPYATQMLGDMGADVIKIEPPEGDIMRAAAASRSPGMGAVYLTINRNKRSAVLDLKAAEARAALLRLCETADVFVHSLRPQAIAKLGLDYAAVAAAKPDIVYCSAWGFRSDGPYAERPAYDDVIQGMSGIADLPTRRGAGGGAPEFAPMVMADKVSGLHAVAAISMALFHRQRTGEGQAIEVPMFESVTSFTLAEHMAGAAFDPPLDDMGYSRVLVEHRRPHKTKDGYMVVLPYNNRQWRNFFAAAGRTEMLDDPRTNDARLRASKNAEMYAMISEIMEEKSTAEWEALLADADVPSERVNRLEDLENDPHFKATGFFQTYEHPSEGRLKAPAAPLRFDKTPAETVRLHPPRLGEQTRAILTEAGLGSDEIEALLAAGTAVQAE
jgi:crotonobetainyl-CoA:carnitine CoA-transferase CaiB-like acyl-CoA transferase